MNAVPRKEYKGVLFDLDGTLVDNYTAVHACIAEVFLESGLEPPSYNAVYLALGGSILVTIKRLLADSVSDARAVALGARYAELFPRHIYEGLKPMPFAREILGALRSKGVKLACFTNKHQSAAEDVLKYLNMFEFFNVVSGTSLLSARKPEVRFTFATLEKLGLGAAECLGIGDSLYDYRAARCAEMDCALVATGADSSVSLEELCPAAVGIFPGLKELAKSVFGISL